MFFYNKNCRKKFQKINQAIRAEHEGNEWQYEGNEWQY